MNRGGSVLSSLIVFAEINEEDLSKSDLAPRAVIW